MISDVNRLECYAATDSTKVGERLQRRLTGDMRARVRRIGPQEYNSDEWIELVDQCQHVAAIATMEEIETFKSPVAYAVETLLSDDEGLLSKSGSLSEPPGSPELGKSHCSSTVWERNAVTVRIIVEEGKTNLIMRTLIESWVLSHSSSTGEGEEYPLANSPPVKALEHALGILVRISVSTLECVQTLDLRNLTEHCATVLRFVQSTNAPVASLERLLLQDGMVISYLAHMVNRLEKIPIADSVWSHLILLNIVPLVLDHAKKYSPLLIEVTNNTSGGGGSQYKAVAEENQYSGMTTHMSHYPVSKSIRVWVAREFPSSYCVFFTALLRNEDFKTHQAKLFPSREFKKMFVAVMEPLLMFLVGAAPTAQEKKAFRPLLDAILRYK